ncbi:Glutaredoxin-C6, partial [Durusdinium trenchii]
AKKVLDSMGADYREVGSVSLGAEWFLASPQQAAKRAEWGLVPLQETGELTDSLKQAMLEL